MVTTSRSFVFFFQAEDGIRDKLVTGVQTCALPISLGRRFHRRERPGDGVSEGAARRGRRFPRKPARALWHWRFVWDSAGSGPPQATSEDGQLLQRFFRVEAGRLRGARGPWHRPVRGPAAGGDRRRPGRVHAAALSRRRAALRAARATRSAAELPPALGSRARG